MIVSDSSTDPKNFHKLMHGTVTDVSITSKLSRRFRSIMYHPC